jgi:hypothetical protein
MTSLNETKITEALAAAKRAKTPDERDKQERAAITALRQIALDTGLNDVLLDRAMKAANDVVGKEKITRDDLDTPKFGDDATELTFAWAALAASLNDLRLGLFRTKAGEALINAAKSISQGSGSWLNKTLTRQGVKLGSEDRDALLFTIVGLVAATEATTGCGIREAIAIAVTEYGARAATYGLPLDPENLRRRINGAGGLGRREDPLATHYRRILKMARKPGAAAALETAHELFEANTATIRGKTSVLPTE